jgi:hypothetical protein
LLGRGSRELANVDERKWFEQECRAELQSHVQRVPIVFTSLL